LIGLGRGFHQRSRSAALDWLMAGFALAFLSWHWLIAFNTYDRYLHTLVPFLIVLAARALTGWWSGQRAERRPLLPMTLVGITACLMIPAVTTCLQGKSRIGGDQGQHTGIDTLANTLNTELSGQIVYDHWLGWELAYYLGDKPRVFIRYAALPEALAEEMTQQAQPCYFVAPSPQEAAPWLEALRRVGIRVSTTYFDPDHHFIIYRLSADPN
jgi:hypothetical protein